MAELSQASGKRIGFDARYINDRYHGIGRYAFRLLEKMIPQAPQHTFVIFRGQGEETRFDWEAISCYRNVEFWEGPWPLYLPLEQLQWPLLLRRSRVDLLHSPYFVAPLLAKAVIVTTVHDLIFDRYPEYMPMAWTRPYYRFLMRAGAARARRVIAVSQATGQDLQQFYQIAPGKIVVIPEGVEPGFQARDDGQTEGLLRRRYRLEKPFILTVGARRPHKNMPRLVQGYAQCAARQSYDLVFAGPADPRFPDEARQAASQAGLDGRVRFLDWVPEADLPALYRLADMVVLPSLIEGFGLPAVEAMASQTPVLASRVSSFPEVIGKAGLLFDPYQPWEIGRAIDRLAFDESLRQRLAAAGRRRAEHFRWEAAARQTLQVYQEALQES